MDYSLLLGVAPVKRRSALQRLSKHYASVPVVSSKRSQLFPSKSDAKGYRGSGSFAESASCPTVNDALDSSGPPKKSASLVLMPPHDSTGGSENVTAMPVSAFRTEYGGLQPSNADCETLPIVFHMGIIDILQPYNFRKKVEHALKSITSQGSTISCVDPTTYACRFLEFMEKNITAVEDSGHASRRSPRMLHRTQSSSSAEMTKLSPLEFYGLGARNK